MQIALSEISIHVVVRRESEFYSKLIFLECRYTNKV